MADKRIKDLTNTATEADLTSGNYFALDGSAGTKKLDSTTLLTKTAQNALAGNVAPAFDPTKPNDADGYAYYINDEVIYNGKLYRFKDNHQSGAWVASHAKEVNIENVVGFDLDEKNLAKQLKLFYKLTITNNLYSNASGYRMGYISAQSFRNRTLKIKAASDTAYNLRYTFLKSFSPVVGEAPDFCDGSSVVVVLAGNIINVIVPADCNYVLVWFGTNTYPFDDFGIFLEKDIVLQQPGSIKPDIYFTTAISSQYAFTTKSDAMVLVYPISGFKELFLNYDNTFTSSSNFTPVYFANSNLEKVGPILTVPSSGEERIYCRNKKIGNFPSSASYIVMVSYVKNDSCSIDCITTKPLGRMFRKIQPTRHNGTFFYQGDYVSNWRLNAFEYDVTGLSYVAIDHCIYIPSGGPYEYLFKLSDDSYKYVWNRNAYTKYDSKYIVPVPSNAVKLIVNSSPVQGKPYYLPRVFSLENEELDSYATLDDFVYEQHKSISLLFVGNSLTQDAVSYLPLLLREVCPDIEFNIYMWYCGGYTLKQQWQNKIDPNVDAQCEIFSVCNTDISWVNKKVKMTDVTNNLFFDFVCLQEYFNGGEAYSASDAQYFNNIVNYIAGLVNFKFEVDCLFHAPKRGSSFETIYELTKNGNIVILKNTPAVDIFVPGCAIYEACKTSLDALGDLGHLSPDGTHAQEGLPCLLEAYVMLLQILNKLGRPITIEGVTSVVDTSNYDSINVPGPNLGTGVVVGTADDYKVAKQVAASSTNKKYAIMSETF